MNFLQHCPKQKTGIVLNTFKKVLILGLGEMDKKKKDTTLYTGAGHIITISSKS